MEIDDARAFVRENHRAVLATRRASGDPQLSPVVCTVDDDGRVTISTRETAMKVKNLRRDPRATVCVFNDSFFGPWVLIDGTAEVVSLPEALEPLVEQYRSIAGEHPDWDDFRSAMQREQRVLVRIDITRAGPERQG